MLTCTLKGCCTLTSELFKFNSKREKYQTLNFPFVNGQGTFLPMKTGHLISNGPSSRTEYGSNKFNEIFSWNIINYVIKYQKETVKQTIFLSNRIFCNKSRDGWFSFWY